MDRTFFKKSIIIEKKCVQNIFKFVNIEDYNLKKMFENYLEFLSFLYFMKKEKHYKIYYAKK